MTGIDRVEDVELRARRATARDGIMEMSLGGLLVVFGVAFLIGTPFTALAVLFPIGLVPLANWLKRRFVHPRIGYAKPLQNPRPIRGILITVVTAFVLLVGALVAFSQILGRPAGGALWVSYLVPAIWGCIMAIGPWTVARRCRLIRWYVIAALFPIGGILLPILAIATGYDAISLGSAIVGGLTLIYGIGLFATFLRAHAVEEASDAAA
jgi:hypothetical protein